MTREILFQRVKLRFVLDQVIEVGPEFHHVALDVKLIAAGDIAVEHNVPVVELGHEGFDFHFHIVVDAC